MGECKLSPVYYVQYPRTAAVSCLSPIYTYRQVCEPFLTNSYTSKSANISNTSPSIEEFHGARGQYYCRARLLKLPVLSLRPRASARVRPVPSGQPYRSSDPKRDRTRIRSLRPPLRRRRVLRQPFLHSSAPRCSRSSPSPREKRETAGGSSSAAGHSIARSSTSDRVGNWVLKMGLQVSGWWWKAGANTIRVDLERRQPGVDGKTIGE